jgi:hypothetical protein
MDACDKVATVAGQAVEAQRTNKPLAPSVRSGLTAAQRVAHAGAHEHRADLDVPQRYSGRITGRDAST